MSALAAVIGAIDPVLAVHAVAEPGAGEFEPLVGDDERGFVVEAIREGYLLHYREPRAFAAMDSDLRLLAGDALFALGLERLASSGDLVAVAELSELISRSARAEAEGRAEGLDEDWRATAERLGRGGTG